MSTRNVVIDTGQSTDQAERDRLPDYDRAKGHTPDTRPAKRGGLPWQVALTLAIGALFIVGYLIVRFVDWLSDVSAETSALDIWLIGALKTALFLAPIIAFGLFLFWLFNKARAASIVRLANNHPVSLSDIRGGWHRGVAREFAAWTLGEYYSTERVWAEHSTYRSLNQLDVSRSYGNSGHSGITDAPIEEERAPKLLGASALPSSEWLAALEESPHLLIYGPSKAGKSTIAQAVVASFGNCEYVVIDPLPNKPGESKWGGIDFVTLCDTGEETATIQLALERILDEDSKRRANMRSIVPTPLIVIIDEVLGLVDMLGMVKDSAGKSETRMSKFIRTMGASARHRGIKIILIGQGKNLVDLGLNSGTARNNYALIRAERNPANNERAAYIVTPDGEQAIDVREVPALANRATQSGRVWLTQEDAERLQDGSTSIERRSDTRGIVLTEQERRDVLIALRRDGKTREQARMMFGLEFSNQEWADARPSSE